MRISDAESKALFECDPDEKHALQVAMRHKLHKRQFKALIPVYSNATQAKSMQGGLKGTRCVTSSKSSQVCRDTEADLGKLDICIADCELEGTP